MAAQRQFSIGFRIFVHLACGMFPQHGYFAGLAHPFAAFGLITSTPTA
jgi:hypothetical protein